MPRVQGIFLVAGLGITEQRKDFERHDSVLRRDRAFLEMHMMEWVLQESATHQPQHPKHSNNIPNTQGYAWSEKYTHTNFPDNPNATKIH